MSVFKLWRAPSISDYSSFGRFPITIELITGGGASREWKRERGQASKKRSQYSSLRGSRESPRRLRNVAARKCVMYFIIVNIGDVRCVWISTIFTMSPRLRLISAGSPINRVPARFRADRLKCSRYSYIFGNLYQAP